MLFSLPCVVVLDGTPGNTIAGMVTGLTKGASGAAKVVMQIERHVPPGTAVSVEWNVPEKRSLPPLQGTVEKCWQPADAAVPAAPKRSTGLLGATLNSGQLVLAVPALPAEIAAWKPGLLIASDLKSHEEMIRA
jgi:hypothetical protein